MAVMIDLNKCSRHNRSRNIARAAAGMLVVASAFCAATAAYAAASGSMLPRYDGLWSVSIVTEKGDCDRGYRYPIRISNGVLANAGGNPFTITGKVVQTGAITVTVSSGSKSATGSGRLAGDIGEGQWTGGECSGSWTAERRG
jgi:hypothetical protein